MVAIDLIINEVAERFGIGGKAIVLYSELLSLMTNQQTGGILGFINRFNQAGMSEIVGSWVSARANFPITPMQIEQALGKDVIARLGYHVGLPEANVAAALSLLIPEVIDYLSIDGEIPPTLPVEFRLPPSSLGATTPTITSPVSAALRKALPYLPIFVFEFLGRPASMEQEEASQGSPPQAKVVKRFRGASQNH
jgi:uncharacterized protein YidB (DUF937 family)